jgi:hypothetical protein
MAIITLTNATSSIVLDRSSYTKRVSEYTYIINAQHLVLRKHKLAGKRISMDPVKFHEYVRRFVLPYTSAVDYDIIEVGPRQLYVVFYSTLKETKISEAWQKMWANISKMERDYSPSIRQLGVEYRAQYQRVAALVHTAIKQEKEASRPTPTPVSVPVSTPAPMTTALVVATPVAYVEQDQAPIIVDAVVVDEAEMARNAMLRDIVHLIQGGYVTEIEIEA